MIQRIQTLYLLASSILVLLWYFMPLADLVNYESNFTFSIYGIKNPDDQTWLYHTLIISIITTISIIATVATIFLYKNRKLQIKASQFLLLLYTTLVAVAFLIIDNAKSLLSLSNEIIIHHKISILFPLISLVLIFLAIKAIKRDEELVRSADRLR
jgi:hypothetical protein